MGVFLADCFCEDLNRPQPCAQLLYYLHWLVMDRNTMITMYNNSISRLILLGQELVNNKVLDVNLHIYQCISAVQKILVFYN